MSRTMGAEYGIIFLLAAVGWMLGGLLTHPAELGAADLLGSVVYAGVFTGVIRVFDLFRR